MSEPLLENPGTTIASVVAAVMVIGVGIWGGLALRRKRLSTYHNPYEPSGLPRLRSGGESSHKAFGI